MEKRQPRVGLPVTSDSLRDGDIVIFGNPERCKQLHINGVLSSDPDREIYGFSNHSQGAYMPHLVISNETYRSRDGSRVSTSGGPCPFSNRFTYTREDDREVYAWAWQGDKGDGKNFGTMGAGLGESYMYTARVWRVTGEVENV
jgi:hypothetical protein